MNREESKVTHIVKIPRETIDCAKCKHCGEQTCVPYGFSCQYEPIIPRSNVRISQKQINDINKIVKQLHQENKKYKEVIEKAIECLTMFPDRWTSDEKKEVLQILKGWNK